MGGDNDKMELSKTKFMFAILLTVIISVSSTYALVNANILFKNHHSPQVQANVYVFKETTTGKDMIYSGNVLTDRIEQKVRNIFAWNNETVYDFNYIALGNSTIDQTNNKLDTEATTLGFGRAANDTCVGWTDGGDFAFNVTNKFTATGNIWVNATALHETGTPNAQDAVAIASLGAMEDFQNNWNCTIIWSITWNAN